MAKKYTVQVKRFPGFIYLFTTSVKELYDQWVREKQIRDLDRDTNAEFSVGKDPNFQNLSPYELGCMTKKEAEDAGWFYAPSFFVTPANDQELETV